MIIAYSHFFLFGIAPSLSSALIQEGSRPAPVKITTTKNKSCCEQHAFPFCFMGTAKCCANGKWVCPSGLDGTTYTCPGKIRATQTNESSFGKPCQKKDEKIVSCKGDVLLCPGSATVVHRDPENNCTFLPCPPPEACTDDFLLCPDGTTYVPRDPANNCAFLPCPKLTIEVLNKCAKDDEKICPDGSVVGRDSSTSDCDFLPCPHQRDGDEVGDEVGDGGSDVDGDDDGVDCEGDETRCRDTVLVIRDPSTTCAHPPCPSVDGTCMDDAFQCPDGTLVRRDPMNECRFSSCPEEHKEGDASDFENHRTDRPEIIRPKQIVSISECADDTFQCSDDSFVLRDPTDDCNFPPCPLPVVIGACNDDFLECPNGSFVRRDVHRNCAFLPCPSRLGEGGIRGRRHSRR